MALDDGLLAHARQARARLVELQHDAEQAQVAYQHAIRRLSAAGGSLREIADALGLSYQRVHQIVDVGAGKGAVRQARATGPCSFCGTATHELVAGPNVFVCARCVDLAAEVVAEGVPRGPLVAVEANDDRARCSFCGKERSQAAGMAAAPLGHAPAKGRRRRERGARICAECLALCDEILAERRATV